MLGKNFVSTRGRLLEIYSDIQRLAEQTSISRDEWGDANASLEILLRPFLLTVCGEVNAGKSSLINVLHGKSICKVNDLPETAIPHRYVSGSVRREINHGDKWRECQIPDEGLNHVNWIDTPGLESWGKSAFTDGREWLEASDLIIVVLPYRNPWSSCTWDFLAKMRDDLQRRVVVVVQCCDLAEPLDLPVLRNHIEDLAQKRMNHQPPVFLVSARKEWETRQLPRAFNDHSTSGIKLLESYLHQKIELCPARGYAMESLRRTALLILQRIDEKVDGLNRAVLRDVNFLEELENEIEQFLQRTVRQQGMGLGAIADEYEKQAIMVSRVLRARLGVIRSLARMMTREQTSQKLEILMQNRLTEAVKTATDRNVESLIRACEFHWAQILERVNDLGGVMATPWPAVESRLQQAREQWVEHMEQAALRSMGQLRVRGVLVHALSKRNAALSVWVALMLVSLIAAGISGGLYVPWVPLIASSAAGVFAICLVVLAMRTARDIVQDYREKLIRSAEVFLYSIRDDYEDGLRSFFRNYAQGLHGIRRSLSERETALLPYAQRWNELFLKIKAIEQEMSF